MSMDERRRLGHLLRRAGFGATPEELTTYEAIGFDGTLDQLLHPESVDEPDHDAAWAAREIAITEKGAIQARWMQRMLETNRPLVEKTALFWHGHFATSVEKVKSVTLMWRQYELFRDQGMGLFPDLLLGVSQDPAMLIWLDNWKSKAEAPNENYGRELLELFTLGVGNYSEEDVKSASRAFTGWSLKLETGAMVGDEGRQPELTMSDEGDEAATETKKSKEKERELDPEAKRQKKLDKLTRDGAFLFRPKWHDGGEKTFLGETGPLDGEDIVRIVTGQRANAEFIARKLFSFFVWDMPDDSTIAPFADTFAGSGGDIRATLEAMFRSEAFSSERAYRAKVRSPIEYLVATSRTLGITTMEPGGSLKRPKGGATGSLTVMGQTPFAPPHVGGWPSGLGWIGPGAMLERYNLALALLGGSAETSRGRGQAVVALPGWLTQPADDPDQLVDLVVARLLDGDIDEDQRMALIAYLSGAVPDPETDEGIAKRAGLARLVFATPAYQLA